MTPETRNKLVQDAPRLSFENKTALENATRCGCYFCIQLFNPAEIDEWSKDKNGDTAICPRCSVDAVIPETDSPLSTELLVEMCEHWFTRPAGVCEPA